MMAKTALTVGCSVPGIFFRYYLIYSPNKPRKERRAGFRVVRQLGQGHTAIQYKSQNSNSWT